MLENYGHGKVIDKENIFHIDDDEIIKILNNMKKIILPWYYHNKVYKVYTIRNHISMLVEDVANILKKQISIVLRYNEEVDDSAAEVIDKRVEEITVKFLEQIPKIRENFETDLQAAYITKSIETGTKVSIKNQELRYSQDNDKKPHELVQDEFWYYVI